MLEYESIRKPKTVPLTDYTDLHRYSYLTQISQISQIFFDHGSTQIYTDDFLSSRSRRFRRF